MIIYVVSFPVLSRRISNSVSVAVSPCRNGPETDPVALVAFHFAQEAKEIGAFVREAVQP